VLINLLLMALFLLKIITGRVIASAAKQSQV